MRPRSGPIAHIGDGEGGTDEKERVSHIALDLVPGQGGQRRAVGGRDGWSRLIGLLLRRCGFCCAAAGRRPRSRAPPRASPDGAGHRPTAPRRPRSARTHALRRSASGPTQTSPSAVADRARGRCRRSGSGRRRGRSRGRTARTRPRSGAWRAARCGACLLGEEAAQRGALLRVEAGGRLVEHEEVAGRPSRPGRAPRRRRCPPDRERDASWCRGRRDRPGRAPGVPPRAAWSRVAPLLEDGDVVEEPEAGHAAGAARPPGAGSRARAAPPVRSGSVPVTSWPPTVIEPGRRVQRGREQAEQRATCRHRWDRADR